MLRSTYPSALNRLPVYEAFHPFSFLIAIYPGDKRLTGGKRTWDDPGRGSTGAIVNQWVGLGTIIVQTMTKTLFSDSRGRVYG